MEPTKYIIQELSGEISAEDARFLEAWKNASEANLQQYQEWVCTWELAGKMPQDFQREKAQSHAAIHQRLSRHRRRRRRYAAAVAAVVLVLIALGIPYLYRTDGQGAASDDAVYYSEDQPKELALPDGTKVLLSPNTTLTPAPQFNQSNRTLTMAGGAFFDVYKNPTLPFVIQVEGFEVTVLGTAFYISDKDDYGRAKVSVVRGWVEVQSGDQKLELHPGQAAVVSTKAHRLTPVPFKPDFTQLPTSPILFDHTSIREVAQILAARYKVQIEIQGNPSKCSFTGTFDTETFEEVSRILEKAVGLHTQKLRSDQYLWIVNRCD